MDQHCKILLVEDDENLGFVVKDNLEEMGYDVAHARDGHEAQRLFYKHDFDVILMDVMLPKVDGFELTAEFRAANPEIPVIFLTAKSLKEDRIRGFRLGADDYVTKPFSMEELQLRIEALMKRVYGNMQDAEKTFRIGRYEFDYDSMQLRLGEKVQKLTQKEAELLRLLCVKKNEVLKREKALELIWGENDYFAGRSMDVFISKLRKHLSEDPHVSIENLHGVGFKLSVSEENSKNDTQTE